jgi:hypothetical protein
MGRPAADGILGFVSCATNAFINQLWIFLIILQNYTTVLEFIGFDHQPLCAKAAAVGTAVAGPTVVAHDGWGLFVVRSMVAGPTGATAAGRLGLGIFRTKSRRYRAPWVGTPTSDFTWSLPSTTLHNHMCPHLVSFLLILYLAEYKLFFKPLNGIKWKGCKLQSFITFRDTQLSCSQFLHLRSFTKLKKQPSWLTAAAWPLSAVFRGPRRFDSNRRGMAAAVRHDVWWSNLTNFETAV